MRVYDFETELDEALTFRDRDVRARAARLPHRVGTAGL